MSCLRGNLLLVCALLLGCTTKLPDTTDASEDSDPTDSRPVDVPQDTAAEVELMVLDAPLANPVGTDEQPLHLRVVAPGRDLATLRVHLGSDRDGDLGSAALDGQGELRWPLGALSVGEHLLQIEVRAAGEVLASGIARVGLCAWPPLEDFATDVIGNGWTLYGDAAWDPGGWLEITGTETFRSGALFKTSQRVNAGDVRLDFSIATGGGLGSGADGFAVSVIDVPDVAGLGAVLDAAAAGGCLGYGVAGACGSLPISAFHIEIDTWYNQGNPIWDPTADDHIAVTLGGDPGDHVLWRATQELEDLVWRRVSVVIAGDHVTATLDGSELLSGTIPGFAFEGGYLGVTGSTGDETNHHRFDDLQIQDRCLVPTD